jgi:hypothetical protein
MTRFLLKSDGDGLTHKYERSKQTKNVPISEYETRFTKLQGTILTLS